MYSKRKKRIKKLLGDFIEGKLSPHASDLVRGWMLDEEDHPLKEEVDMELFDKHIKLTYIPDRNTMQSLSDIHQRLGFPERKKSNIFIRLRPAMAIAAVLAVVITVGTVLLKNGEKIVVDPQIATITVQAQQDDEKISLPDGTEIILSKGTDFKYSENFIKDRTVFLNGEGYFKVAKLDGQTFTVKTNSISVTVLGTEFNMKARDEAQTAEVVLTTGKVEVSAEGIDNTLMAAGEKVVYNKKHQTITLEEIGERELLRLRGMSIDFDNSLDEIFHSISRYYGVKVIVRDSMDLQRHIKVPFKGTEKVEDVLSGLQFMTGSAFDYAITNDTISITKPN